MTIKDELPDEIWACQRSPEDRKWATNAIDGTYSTRYIRADLTKTEGVDIAAVKSAMLYDNEDYDPEFIEGIEAAVRYLNTRPASPADGEAVKQKLTDSGALTVSDEGVKSLNFEKAIKLPEIREKIFALTQPAPEPKEECACITASDCVGAPSCIVKEDAEAALRMLGDSSSLDDIERNRLETIIRQHLRGEN